MKIELSSRVRPCLAATIPRLKFTHFQVIFRPREPAITVIIATIEYTLNCTRIYPCNRPLPSAVLPRLPNSFLLSPGLSMNLVELTPFSLEPQQVKGFEI
jgi:hypothetical protein